MGVDACIYFKIKDDCENFELEFDELPNNYKIVPVLYSFAPEGATHEVDTCERYYGQGYDLGSWPRICTCLMLLHATESVEKVWYGGDHEEILKECSIERVLDLSKYFMLFGYRGEYQ